VDGTINSNHSGYTGNGFSNTTNTLSTGVEWEISVPVNASFSMSWRYANGSSSNRTAELLVDGRVVVSNTAFQGTGSWSSWQNTSAEVKLNAGNHRIRLQASMNEGLANIDSLQVSGNHPQATDCDSGSSSSTPQSEFVIPSPMTQDPENSS
jgi:hypothetical protein